MRAQSWRPGIGPVVLVIVAIMAIVVGTFLYAGYDEKTDFADGQLRSYATGPAVKWSADLSRLQPQVGATVSVAGVAGSTWLVRSSVSQDNVFATIDAESGRRGGHPTIDAGFGGCAIAGNGTVGCSVQSPLDNRPDGFYATDSKGVLGSRHDAPAATQIVAQGDDFLLANNVEFTVTRLQADGKQVWQKTFGAAPQITSTDGSLIVHTADGRTYLLDPDNGDERYHCSSCEATAYPTGIAVQQNGDDRSVEFFTLAGTSVSTANGQELVHGPSSLPLVTEASGTGNLPAAQGTFVAYDPAMRTALWKASTRQLSTAGAFTCGDVAVLRKFDDSRSILELRTGKQLGNVPPQVGGDPRADIRTLQCLGATSSRIVAADGAGLMTAFNARNAEVAWQVPDELGGTPAVVDGYLTVVANGTLTVLQPN